MYLLDKINKGLRFLFGAFSVESAFIIMLNGLQNPLLMLNFTGL